MVLRYDNRTYPGEIRRWNKTLAECYMRGCVCKGCPIYENIFAHNKMACQCKHYVIAAVCKFGVPESLQRKNDIISEA